RSANIDTDADLLSEARNRADAARRLLEQEQTAWREFSLKQPYESMRADLEALTDSRTRVERDLFESRAELAELQVRNTDSRLAAVRARVELLEKQNAEIDRQLQSKGAQFSERNARADEFQQRLRAAQTTYDAAATRLREIEASAGSRGERMRVVDPGL